MNLAATATAASHADAFPMVGAAPCQEAADEWEARFAEDAANARREPDLKQISRTLASVRDERLASRPDLHIEMANAVLSLPSGGKARAKLSALGVGIESIRAAFCDCTKSLC